MFDLMPSRSERKALSVIRKAEALDGTYYRRQLPFWQRLLLLRPALHYLRTGWKQGLAPNSHFHTGWYLARYPDVAASGINPLVHFLNYGMYEGRAPAPNGDIAYRERLVPLRGWSGSHGASRVFHKAAGATAVLGSIMVALAPFPTRSEKADLVLISRSGTFERRYYLRQFSFLHRLLIWNPPLHYMRVGASLGASAHPHFDEAWYASRWRREIRRFETPLLHFLHRGLHDGARPSAQGYLSDFPALREEPAWAYQQAQHGHAAAGVAALERLVEQGVCDALWYLAAWHFGQGEAEQAWEALKRLQALGGGRFAVHLPQALAKCLLQLGDDEGVKALCEAGHFVPSSLDAALVRLSQVERPVEERLEGINAWLQRYKLAPLRLRKNASRLSLASLRTRRVRARGQRLPWVTVVVPAYNASATIRMALKSLLAQSWPRLEILVVDDASEDDTAAKVEELARTEPRVRLIRHERNRGAYAARNTGMRAARGAYLTVHDSDDWAHPERIARQLRELQRKPEA